jgi:hypothetical protein
MRVRCNQIFWDSTKCNKLHPGDTDEVDPLEPKAMYFDWPEGTEVYYKIKGKKPDKDGKGGSPNIETTRIVGQPYPKEARPKTVPKIEEEEIETCDVCGVYQGSHMQTQAHRRHCIKKQAADEVKE